MKITSDAAVYFTTRPCCLSHQIIKIPAHPIVNMFSGDARQVAEFAESVKRKRRTDDSIGAPATSADDETLEDMAESGLLLVRPSTKTEADLQTEAQQAFHDVRNKVYPCYIKDSGILEHMRHNNEVVLNKIQFTNKLTLLGAIDGLLYHIREIWTKAHHMLAHVNDPEVVNFDTAMELNVLLTQYRGYRDALHAWINDNLANPLNWLHCALFKPTVDVELLRRLSSEMDKKYRFKKTVEQ